MIREMSSYCRSVNSNVDILSLAIKGPFIFCEVVGRGWWDFGAEACEKKAIEGSHPKKLKCGSEIFQQNFEMA